MEINGRISPPKLRTDFCEKKWQPHAGKFILESQFYKTHLLKKCGLRKLLVFCNVSMYITE